VSELHLETFSKMDLIRYLVRHIYPRAGVAYKQAAAETLSSQTTETLLAMAKTTHAEKLARQEKLREQRLDPRRKTHEHAR